MAKCKNLLDLPADMVWNIMLLVSAASVKDFVKMKLCCTRLKLLGEHHSMCSTISLRGLTHYGRDRHASFLNKCLAKNNPDALYRAGFANFFGGDYPPLLGGAVGLVQLEAASDGKNLDATYTLAFLRIFNWEGDVPLIEQGYRQLAKVCAAGKERECRTVLYEHRYCFWPARESHQPPPLPKAQCSKKHWKRTFGWTEEYEYFEDPSCIDCRCDAEVDRIAKTFWWPNLPVHSYK